MKKISRLIAILLISTTVSFADTIRVPVDQPTIQAGIDVAVNGDIVLVAPGTYVENIDFLGKAITVKSDLGPRVTVVDGGQSTSYNRSVVSFINFEGPDSVLDGFTLTNGKGLEYGGTLFGGGIIIGKSAPIIKNNIITQNMSMMGGGISCNMSSATITNNFIIENHAVNIPGYGGGLYCFECEEIKIVNNVISDNTADEGIGGGMALHYPMDDDNLVANNIVTGNSAGVGGGIYCYAVSWIADTNVYYNTIVNNSAQSNGGGFYRGGGTPDIYNCIFWDNTAPENPEIGSSSSPLPVYYCNVKGGWVSGYSNIDADPLFVDASNRDFHLRYDSPCRDAGLSSFLDIVSKDMDGNARLSATDVDMGADEFHNHFYCTGDITPSGAIEGKFVGSPGTTPIGLFIGSGVLIPPLQHKWGEFYLESPWLLFPLAPIPANGVLEIPAILPSTPAPYDIPMQALIGWELSNLFVVEVRL